MTAAVRLRRSSAVSTVTTRPTGRPVIASRSVVTQSMQRITADQCNDPETLAKTLSFLEDAVQRATAAGRNDPELGAILFQGISVTGGTLLPLTHNFGRPFAGYRVTRTYLGAGAAISFQDATLPAGLSYLTTVALMPSATGKVDVKVW